MQPQVFDTYAPTYDMHFTNSLIGKAQRQQVYRHALGNAYFFQKTVLEVNCGTGEDALWLSKQGAQVLATDVSEKMLHVAKVKNKDVGVIFKQLPAQEIVKLSPEKYQNIFSNFGGLNCLNPIEIEQFRDGCVKLQNPEDRLVFVIMGRKCVWEKFVYRYLMKDHTKERRRLANDGVKTIIDDNLFDTYYYSPNEIRQLFMKDYNHIATKPIGFFVPPSYLEPYFIKRKVLLKLLNILDWLFPFSFLSNYADHYIIIFEKK